MPTIDSSKITWTITQGSGAYDSSVNLYCADGDGIVVVATYPDRIELLDQLDVCKTWATDADIGAVLEEAQEYLYSAYPEIYAEAMHFCDAPTTDELRLQMNFIHGYGHLD